VLALNDKDIEKRLDTFRAERTAAVAEKPVNE
jgi:phosphoribosylcarboxyaminoimidazole (NCAIR) mutase